MATLFAQVSSRVDTSTLHLLIISPGPSEVTVFDPEVLVKLDGPGSKTQKSLWYDFLMPDVGVTTIRDRPFHDQRRKIWTQAFSSKSTYSSRLVENLPLTITKQCLCTNSRWLNTRKSSK